MSVIQSTYRKASNFSLAFIGLEKSRRQALEALYSFCREVDDIVDHNKEEQKAYEQLNRWRESLSRIKDPSLFDPPATHQLSIAMKNFPILVSDLHWIIDGVEMDLTKKRYESDEELFKYCDGVATSVGFCTMAILGAERERTEKYTFAMGRALQMTNILRDVGEDARMGRIYLPLQDLERFSISEKDLFRGVYSEKFFDLMKYEKRKIESLYQLALTSLPAKERKKYAAAEVMRKIYYALLRKIESNGYSVFGQAPRLSKVRKLAIAISIWMPHMIRRTLKPGNA